MPWPTNLDTDPNVARMSLECVLTLTPASGQINNPQLPAIAAAVTAKTGVAPKSIIASGGSAIITMPGDRWVWDYIGSVMSAAAANGLAGSVTGYDQGRVV